MTDGFSIQLALIYLIYGLAFFIMGVALFLEAGRMPVMVEARVLRPLAVFGITHGIHEWLELALSMGMGLGYTVTDAYHVVRIAFLVFSFLSLIAFGVQVISSQKQRGGLDIYIGLVMFLGYGLLLVWKGAFPQPDQPGWHVIADGLARYWLAVPGGLLACYALFQQSRVVGGRFKEELASKFRWAALGFGMYGLTQGFVAPADYFPATIFNQAVFLSLIHIPVQVVRAGLAVWVTLYLVQALKLIDREREKQLIEAKEAEVRALQQVQDEMKKRETMRRELLRHIVMAQEEERTRIARELHDETAQILTAFSFDLATLQTMLEGQPAGSEVVSRLQRYCQRVSSDLYHLIHQLRPAQLDDLGLVSSLRGLVDEYAGSMNLKVAFAVSGEVRRHTDTLETVLYRVTQEALNNILRHANASSVSICLCYTSDEVRLHIHDDGEGFDVDEVLRRGPGMYYWGVLGMRERVESVGGNFYLYSKPGRGTRIDVKIPISEDSLDGE